MQIMTTKQKNGDQHISLMQKSFHHNEIEDEQKTIET